MELSGGSLVLCIDQW